MRTHWAIATVVCLTTACSDGQITPVETAPRPSQKTVGGDNTLPEKSPGATKPDGVPAATTSDKQESGYGLVSAAQKLPECNKGRDGSVVYVFSEKTFYACSEQGDATLAWAKISVDGMFDSKDAAKPLTVEATAEVAAIPGATSLPIVQAAVVEAGPAGPQGLQGEAGPAGPTGPQGLMGLHGLKGDKGDRGELGPVGSPGAAGLAGAKGDKGDKGDAGAQGIQGIQGVQGLAGLIGLQGLTGATGAQGSAGASGGRTKIHRLYSGDAGAAYTECVNTGRGNSYTLYHDVNDNDVWDGPTSVDGASFRIVNCIPNINWGSNSSTSCFTLGYTPTGVRYYYKVSTTSVSSYTNALCTTSTNRPSNLPGSIIVSCLDTFGLDCRTLHIVTPAGNLNVGILSIELP